MSGERTVATSVKPRLLPISARDSFTRSYCAAATRRSLLKNIYHITGINPEPWTASQAARGKTHISFYKQAKLVAYQQAIKEELPLQNGHIFQYPKDTPIRIEFFLYRQLDGDDEKKQRANWADATNLQKSTEDALQGILYDNDKRNRDVRTVVVEQTPETEPHITIIVWIFDPAIARTEVAKYPRPIYNTTHKSNVQASGPELF